MARPLYLLPTREKLKELIQMKSTTPPGNVKAVVDALIEFASDLDVVSSLQEVEPDKHNCLMTFDFGPGRTLVFNSHMDVNNPNGQIWSFDPFTPFEKENKLYGLGACDTKGSMAAMLTAFERIVADSKGVRGKVLFTAVMGEEAGGIGSEFLVEKGLCADAGIVGEPTELQICTAHKGTYMRKLVFHGKAAHSASSHLGINAIDQAARFCVLYNQLSEKLKQDPHAILGPANASVTVIQGGTRQNTIPESCSLIIDRRLLPGETSEKADKELHDILEELQQLMPQTKVDWDVIVSTVPSQTPSSEEIVSTSLDIVNSIVGPGHKAFGFNAGCDMSKLVNTAGIPTVIIGPGSLKNAHSPDEFVDLEQLDQAADIYEGIIRSYLKET